MAVGARCSGAKTGTMLDGGGGSNSRTPSPMPTWTLHLVSCAGLVALLGRLPVPSSVIEAFLIGTAAFSLMLFGLFGLFGNKALRPAASRLRALQSPHPTSSSPVLRGAHA